jgi:hypothetical protein
MRTSTKEQREYNRKYYIANREKKKEQSREWRAANPEKAHEIVRNWRAANPYKDREYAGLPSPTRPMPELCEIPGCVRAATDLDHCHKSGAFRGWLCGRHNRGLGLIGDTLAFARAAVLYLEKSEDT